MMSKTLLNWGFMRVCMFYFIKNSGKIKFCAFENLCPDSRIVKPNFYICLNKKYSWIKLTV